jgi:hypothetical protein
MNSIICLALSCLLVGLLYVYMRQQFAAQDRKIHDLTQLVASVATELQQQTGPYPFAAPPQPPTEVKRSTERVTVSDDSESEADTDDEDDSESEDEVEKEKVQPKEKAKSKEVEVKEEYHTIETEDIAAEDLSIVLDISEGVKTINLFDTVEVVKPNYDKLTVKELKDLVLKEGGPASLKTKKDLIDFLEKKK